MTRLFTILSLLFATTFLFGQQASFTGHKVTSEYENSAELQHSFKLVLRLSSVGTKL